MIYLDNNTETQEVSIPVNDKKEIENTETDE